MQIENEYRPTSPFDLFSLHLIHLLARLGSFTRVAEEAGLTQSAVTRQIQAVESRIGVPLFERTTRKVTITPAGHFLLDQTRRIIGDLDSTLRRLREDFIEGPKEIRVGVSQEISLAYLPGILFANQPRTSGLNLTVSHQSPSEVISQLESDDLDIGLLCPPRRIPKALTATHRFPDTFTLIVPRSGFEHLADRPTPAAATKALAKADWLLISEASHTGIQLRRWMKTNGLPQRSAHEMDNFDLIINLVAMGLGCSFVPQRALALYARRRQIRRISLKSRFSRQNAVLVRKSRSTTPHIQDFIARILF